MQSSGFHCYRGRTEVSVEHCEDCGAHAAGTSTFRFPLGQVQRNMASSKDMHGCITLSGYLRAENDDAIDAVSECNPSGGVACLRSEAG